MSLRGDLNPYRPIRTADDSLRVVWAAGVYPQDIYHLYWSAYRNPGWTTAQPLFEIDSQTRDVFPHLSKGDDGSIAMTFVRTPIGVDEGDLMLSILYPDSLVWTDPIVIRSPVAYGPFPVVANVNADSLWVFFNRGVKLRAKPVFHGVPGGEYIFDNLDGGTYAWQPTLLRTQDGTIWVFWDSGYDVPPIERIQYLTLGQGGFIGPTYLPTIDTTYFPDVLELSPNQICLAYTAEEPVPPGNGASVIKTKFWDGSTWGEEHWIAGDEGVKRQCEFGRLGIDSRGQLLLVYDCQVAESSVQRVDLYSTVWNGSEWCSRESLGLPQVDQYWFRTFQRLALTPRGRPLVVYGYGPTVGFDLYSTEVVTSVPTVEAQVHIQRRDNVDIEAEVPGTFTGPTWVLIVYGRGTSETQWDHLSSIATEKGQWTYPISGVDAYGALRVDLYDLTTGETVAQSNVLERGTIVSREPILWSRMTDGTIQFCRNNAVTPRAMSGAIYDLAGRKVAELSDFQATSQLCAEWPGTDSRGRSVASGIYMARFVSKEAGRDRMHALRIMVRH